jgi:hypothetical protein
VPRVIVEEDVLAQLTTIPHYVASEDGVHFIDPFNVAFVISMQRFGAEMAATGQPLGGSAFQEVDPITYIQSLLPICKAELLSAKDARVWSKMAWLYDRLSIGLGLGLRANMISRPPT